MRYVAPTGPSPPGINCSKIVSQTGLGLGHIRIWNETRHADVVAVQQNFWELGLCARVVTTPQQSISVKCKKVNVDLLEKQY